MSSHRTHVPEPSQIDDHADRQVQRVERAFKAIEAGDVLAVVDDRVRQIVDPAAHPLYAMVQFFLDRQTAVDGAKLYDDWRQLILGAIDSLMDDALECLGED